MAGYKPLNKMSRGEIANELQYLLGAEPGLALAAGESPIKTATIQRDRQRANIAQANTKLNGLETVMAKANAFDNRQAAMERSPGVLNTVAPAALPMQAQARQADYTIRNGDTLSQIA